MKPTDGQAGEDGVSIESALVGDGGARDGLEPGEMGEFEELIDAEGTFCADVDFLQRDQIGLDGLDDRRDTGQVNLAVGSFTVVDVVAENAYQLLRRGSG